MTQTMLTFGDKYVSSI